MSSAVAARQLPIVSRGPMAALPLTCRQLADPADLVVYDVPQPSQDASGCEGPGYLGSRDLHVEPVQGIAGNYGVDGGGREREGLGRSQKGPDGR